MRLLNKNLFVIAAFSLMLACNSEKNKLNTDGIVETGSADNSDATDSSSKTLKVYTLPAPLQIATAVKTFDLNYSDKLLVPNNKSTVNYPTNYLKALNLGVFGIDMGYTTVYEQKQSAIYYLSKVQKLTEELGITDNFNLATVKRFKDNISNQDSLYYIILQSFNGVHKYLHENDRAGTGLLILTGSFVEGLYLTTQFAQSKKDNRLYNLISQQQVFLDNLIELLRDLKEAADLCTQLKDLKISFQGITISNANSNFNKKSADTISISNEQLDKITNKVAAIRNKITA